MIGWGEVERKKKNKKRDRISCGYRVQKLSRGCDQIIVFSQEASFNDIAIDSSELTESFKNTRFFSLINFESSYFYSGMESILP